MNTDYEGAKVLYNYVLDNQYKNIFEIGTSTGHSTIWLAMAAMQTGGKVVTIEIDERRYKIALKNFEEAGVSEYIDARLGDAHKLAPAYKGKVDFAYFDADKDWQIQYFKDIADNVVSNGVIVTDNMDWRFPKSSMYGYGGKTVSEYAEYQESRQDFDVQYMNNNRLSIAKKK